MARVYSGDNQSAAMQAQLLKDQRERDDRAAVASGNVDENSALYRHAKLNGWDLGGKDELHGPARANAVARDAAATSLIEQRGAGAPRSPISSFAANMDTGFFMNDEDSQLRAGFDGIMVKANAQKADRARRSRATLGSMVGHAMDNGGMVPRELGAAYGQELGQSGPAFGTLAKDGTFMSLGIGQDGNVQPTGLVKPFDVMKSMVQSGDWKNAEKYAKKYLDGKYTPEQIANATGYSPQWVRGAATNEISAADKKLQLEALKVLVDMDKANKAPVSAEDFFRNNPRLLEMLGKDYQRDENGALVMGDDGQPISITLPPDEISKRAVAFFDGLRQSEANGGGTGMNEIQRAIVDGIRALTTPPEQQQAANIPQTGFYYRRETPNGPEMVATSGYVVGGQAYDRYGNLMQGVQPLDYQGNPISGATAQSAQPTREEVQAELARRRAVKMQHQSAPLSQPVTSLESPAPAQGQYGLRNDGKTYKGTGWLGELKLPNGGVATEYTMQSDAVRDANGNRIDFPSLVPTLTKGEVDLMVNDIIPNNKPVPDAIAQKAVDFARDRMSKGQSVFANDGQQPAAQTAAPSADDNAEHERRAQNGVRQRESILRQAGVSEEVAQHYDSIDREIMRRFHEAIPDATDADIYSGKYDREIAAAARLADDTSTLNVIEQARALRAQYESAQRGEAVESARANFDKEYRSGMDAIRKEADAKGIRGNWSKQERDYYIKREEFMLKNKLRKRLVNAQQAIS